MITPGNPLQILAIIPAYNEEGNIVKTIDEVLASKIPMQILVVNDGSKDGTEQKACLAGVRVVSLPFNLGIGGAIQTGFQFALENNFDVALQIDGDGQHDVKYVETLLNPIMKNQADMVIGSRFLPPYLGYQSSFMRRIGIHFFSYLISTLTGCRTSDPTSGFRAYNRKMIKAFARGYPQDFPEPEAIVVAQRLKARVVEVPVEMRERLQGHSSIRYLKTLYYMIKVSCAILLNMVKVTKEME